jgi:hypothetical protein
MKLYKFHDAFIRIDDIVNALVQESTTEIGVWQLKIIMSFQGYFQTDFATKKEADFVLNEIAKFIEES